MHLQHICEVVCLSVCLYIRVKRKIHWTDLHQTFHATEDSWPWGFRGGQNFLGPLIREKRKVETVRMSANAPKYASSPKFQKERFSPIRQTGLASNCSRLPRRVRVKYHAHETSYFPKSPLPKSPGRPASQCLPFRNALDKRQQSIVLLQILKKAIFALDGWYAFTANHSVNLCRPFKSSLFWKAKHVHQANVHHFERPKTGGRNILLRKAHIDPASAKKSRVLEDTPIRQTSTKQYSPLQND